MARNGHEVVGVGGAVEAAADRPYAAGAMRARVLVFVFVLSASARWQVGWHGVVWPPETLRGWVCVANNWPLT